MKISVIIPTHNRDDLERAIKSVIEQTVLPLEVVIIDDLGRKETENVVNSFNSDLLVYIRNKNGRGASSSRNLGVSLAKGDYVAF